MFQKEELTLVNYAAGQTLNGYKSFLFGPAQIPDLEKRTIYLSGGILHGCRDAFGKAVRKMIINNDKNLSLDKTRLLFNWTADNRSNGHESIKSQHQCYKEWCERGLKIIHTCEKLAGWPMTKVWFVKAPQDYQYMVHTLSSRRWMKSPYLITLYIMLMRIAEDTKIVNFKNFDELEKLLDKHKNNLKRDGHHVGATLQWWRFILKGYPDLFRQYKLPYYWSLARIPGNYSEGYGEGIARLCDGTTKYKEAWQKLQEIKEKLTKEEK